MAEKRVFTVGEEVTAKNNEPLEGNDVAPSLVLGQKYPIIGITVDSAGNQHLDVGLQSKYSYIRSYETGEPLPNGDKIHWCHPSRFEEYGTPIEG
jgi:hypothetical protein